jgi:phage protein D
VESSLANGNLSTPGFILYINNTRIPPEREAEIKKIIIADKLNTPSSFFIHVADSLDEWRENDDYYIGSKVKILMGYKDSYEEMISGEITEYRCYYKKNEAVHVVISGQNLLHRLKRFKRIQAFNDMTVKDIISRIADEAGLNADVEELGYEHPFALQRDMNDFEYLLTLSDRYDCYFYVKDSSLSFKRLILNKAEDTVLEYGKTLLEFYPEANTSRIVSQVDVIAWNPAKCEAVSATAAFGDIKAQGGEVVDKQFGGAISIHIDSCALDQNNADQLAIDILSRNTRDYVTGTGKTFGNPGIRAGTIIKAEGLANKFNGKYFILSATHVLYPMQGYTTSFSYTSSLGTPASSGTAVQTTQKESIASSAAEEETKQEKTEQAKNPSITNLRWMKDGEQVTRANVDDAAVLTADVRDIDDGDSIQINIWEKDKAGSDDFITRVYSPVKNGKVEKEWKVEYHEDIDDIESKQEQEEKGYTLPEYVFKMETTTGPEFESEESPVLEVVDWMEIKVVDESGKPLKNEKVTILKNNEKIQEAETDENGYVKVEGLCPGKFNIQLDEEKFDYI